MANNPTPSVDQIRERAYQLWQADGRPEGRSTEYWLRAEADLAGTADPGDGRGEEGAPTAMDEPAAAPAKGRRKAAPTEAPAEAAAQESEGRGGYVQQKRTRRKAEGFRAPGIPR
jgi:hypothetical protein